MMSNKLFSNVSIIKFDTLNSTNDYSIFLLKEKGDKLKNFTVIWALNQTNGRGQKGNKWISESGKNLTFSIIYFPKSEITPLSQFILNQIVSLGIIEFLNFYLESKRVKIKWPNDIYVDNKKIAGILIENQIYGNKIKSSIIGIGININQIKFSNELASATSLKQLTNNDFNIENEIFILLSKLEKRFQQLINYEYDTIKMDYLNNLLYLGEKRQFYYKDELITGKINGIDKYGKLQIIKEDNRKIIADFKEIVFIHTS